MVMRALIFKKPPFFPPTADFCFNRSAVPFSEAKTEIIRKSIHFLIAFTPAMATLNYALTILLLMAGVSGYIIMELMRLSGVPVPVVSALTTMASRPQDSGSFVLGPVTLGIGTLLALLLFPLPAAFIGIYALAFGDGFSALAGKLFGRIRPAFLLGKSVEGALACFTATYIAAWIASQNGIIALAAAFTAAAVESLPLEDYDNIAIPITVALVVHIMV